MITRFEFRRIFPLPCSETNPGTQQNSFGDHLPCPCSLLLKDVTPLLEFQTLIYDSASFIFSKMSLEGPVMKKFCHEVKDYFIRGQTLVTEDAEQLSILET